MSIDSNMVMRQIGAKISYWRILFGISQSDLAKRCNMSKSTIAKIECGNYNNNISMMSLINIAEALGVDFTVLITFNDCERKMWENTVVAAKNADEV